jgi:hypothetical protein
LQTIETETAITDQLANRGSNSNQRPVFKEYRGKLTVTGLQTVQKETAIKGQLLIKVIIAIKDQFSKDIEENRINLQTSQT